MAFYSVEVTLDNIVCRDTESIHSSDKFALSGVVFTDLGQPAAFTFPIMRINSGETRQLGQLLFNGSSVAPKVGLVFQAWDIDNNESWVENRADIDQIVTAISDGVKFIPEYGTVAGIILDGAKEVVMNAVDRFVDWDKNDSLIDYRVWHDLPPSSPYVPASVSFAIDGKREDPLGYSSFDYSLNVSIVSTPMPPLWPEPSPQAASDDAAAIFRQRADAAAQIGGFVGAFPTFNTALRGQDWYGGTVLLNPNSSEWRDVPAAVLGNPDKHDFGHRMRVTQDYAHRYGFLGGFPTFYEGERGEGLVFGTVLLRHAYATWRDVPISELGNPPLTDIEERFRRTQDYAVRNGFIGGYPNFYHANYGGELRCGTILVPSAAGEWRDIFIRRLPT